MPVARLLAAHDGVIGGLQLPGQGAGRTICQRLSVDRKDWHDLLSGTAIERFLRQIKLGAADLALLAIEIQVACQFDQGGPGDAFEDAGRYRRGDQTALADDEQAAARTLADAAITIENDGAAGTAAPRFEPGQAAVQIVRCGLEARWAGIVGIAPPTACPF